MQPSKINFSQTDIVYFCSVVQMVLLRYITNDEERKKILLSCRNIRTYGSNTDNFQNQGALYAERNG